MTRGGSVGQEVVQRVPVSDARSDIVMAFLLLMGLTEGDIPCPS